jgi:hypothetical protein
MIIDRGKYILFILIGKPEISFIYSHSYPRAKLFPLLCPIVLAERDLNHSGIL